MSAPLNAGLTLTEQPQLQLDELQTLNTKRLSVNDIVYTLGNGNGKTRGRVGAGLQKVETWRNCILSTGEQPMIGNTGIEYPDISQSLVIDEWTIKITNQAGIELPSTGGYGIGFHYFFGVTLIGIAGTGFMMKRRRRNMIRGNGS